MATYKFSGHISENHTITLPQEIPVGWAEIVVHTEIEQASLHDTLNSLEHRGSRSRTKEDIDSELHAERRSWE